MFVRDETVTLGTVALQNHLRLLDICLPRMAEMTGRHDSPLGRTKISQMRPEPEAARPSQPDRRQASARRPVALIVDDDIEVASMTAMALGTQGWHTIAANAPQEAASIARDLPIDLLVTDLNMPGMSGVELAALVRAHRHGLPIVLVSGWPEAAALRIEPPFAFLPKPFGLQALFGVITSLAGGAGGGSGSPAAGPVRTTARPFAD